MKTLNKKSLVYWYYRIMKQPGTPDSLARGVAIGLFIGFIIPFGFQMIVALPLAVLLKARKLPAVVGTWVTNHFTIGVIYPLQCYLGSVLLGHPLSVDKIKDKFGAFFTRLGEIEGVGWRQSVSLSFKALFDLGDDIVVPFFVGGAVLGAVCAALGYFATYGMILRFRAGRKRKLNRKLSAAAHHGIAGTSNKGVRPQ